MIVLDGCSLCFRKEYLCWNSTEQYMKVEKARSLKKKSRFIATVHPVESEEEALAFLEEMKKKYWETQLLCVFDWDES